MQINHPLYGSKGLHCYPLKQHQVRVKMTNGSFAILDTEQNTLTPVVPEALRLGGVAALLSISHQGPLSLSALNYLQYSKQAIMATCIYDPFHRTWNDVRGAANKSQGKLWKTICATTLVSVQPELWALWHRAVVSEETIQSTGLFAHHYT